MALTKIPQASALEDQQYIQVTGPDGMLRGFSYDAQTKSLHARESQITRSGYHGSSHISEDLIPSATCDSPGLMSADDKAKLDALLQTRVGIAGWQGSGFADDGGWLSSDIIFAAGSEFISLERFGNVIRWTVDAPIQLSCSQEACAQIYWVQDETEVSSIRPPSCAGRLPGLSGYGELKIYLMPESTLVNPSNPSAILSTKGNYPVLAFKRYDDSVTPGLGELELVLKRDSNNALQTSVGWAMTPGPTSVPECVWFMGSNTDGDIIRFELSQESNPNMLGALLYNGHLLTKRMAVITGYTSQILSTNQYTCRFWDTQDGTIVSGVDSITATNIWNYSDPENVNNSSLTLDRTIGLLPVGTLVDLWFFQVGEVSGTPIRRYYFSKKPDVSADNFWGTMGAVEFGNTLESRVEINAAYSGSTSYLTELVNDATLFEHSVWGMTGFDDPIMLYDDIGTGGIAPDLNIQSRGRIDLDLPGLLVNPEQATDTTIQRPVLLWNRHNSDSFLAKMYIGRPASGGIFPPYDILLCAPISMHNDLYLKTAGKGVFSSGSAYYAMIKGAQYRDLPESGTIRMVSGTAQNTIWRYNAKMLYPAFDDEAIALVSDDPFPGEVADIVELLHHEFNGPCARVEFSESDDGEVQLQIKVGVLDMGEPYEEGTLSEWDDLVHGLTNYAISKLYTQATTFDGSGTQPSANTDGFVVYDGGYPDITGSTTEYWNVLEIMQRNDQVWVWWNGLLIPPDTDLSSALEVPVDVSTPYFPITKLMTYGKFGVRLWPGAKFRKAAVYGQGRLMNEYLYGQLELS